MVVHPPSNATMSDIPAVHDEEDEDSWMDPPDADEAASAADSTVGPSAKVRKIKVRKPMKTYTAARWARATKTGGARRKTKTTGSTITSPAEQSETDQPTELLTVPRRSKRKAAMEETIDRNDAGGSYPKRRKRT